MDQISDTHSDVSTFIVASSDNYVMAKVASASTISILAASGTANTASNHAVLKPSMSMRSEVTAFRIAQDPTASPAIEALQLPHSSESQSATGAGLESERPHADQSPLPSSRADEIASSVISQSIESSPGTSLSSLPYMHTDSLKAKRQGDFKARILPYYMYKPAPDLVPRVAVDSKTQSEIVLPSPPLDDEKWYYLHTGMLFLVLSYAKVLLGRTGFDMKLHLELQRKYDFFSGTCDAPSIDVFLPCCGESIFVLENTYKFVQKLRWPAGKLNVHVLDDGYSDEVQQLAAAFGFNYIRRPDRPHLKKAGNLRNAFKQTSSEFILVLDADFTPRTDFLTETVPYVVNDPEIAILQTPQFFRVLKCQTWIEKGAGSVQELFYRLIQQYRDSYGAAICVGTSALYRRAALAPFGGTAAVEHSEDMRTGFMCMNAGWRTKYIPINLTLGICPNDFQSFFNQQYRWCSGSTSLLTTPEFWKTKQLTASQKLCFLSGMLYYMASAISQFVNPLFSIALLIGNSNNLKWYNIAFALPSVCGGMLAQFIWARQRYGLYTLRVQIISAYSHMMALKDAVFNTRMQWIPTGGAKSQSSKAGKAGVIMFVWQNTLFFGVVGLSVWRLLIGDVVWYNIVPLILLNAYEWVLMMTILFD
ncbi:hypothetical protein HDU83_004046 [Entophlyctis luteolus]|nr:hypothetical protein HDU83_004046 [Entophlyctis luteolus]